MLEAHLFSCLEFLNWYKPALQSNSVPIKPSPTEMPQYIWTVSRCFVIFPRVYEVFFFGNIFYLVANHISMPRHTYILRLFIQPTQGVHFI